MNDLDDYHEQLQRDSRFLCSDQRMDTDLVDRLVLQLNRIHPQILNDKEAHRFRSLSVPTTLRLEQLLQHLRREGDEACHEFYRGLHLEAEDVYRSLPSRGRQRGEVLQTESTPSTKTTDVKGANTVAVRQKRHVLNDKGPMFFMSCFSVAAGLAALYYYGEGKMLKQDWGGRF